MARPDEVNGRYSAVSLTLHWLIAALVVGQVLLIMAHDGVSGSDPDPWMPLHKANGIMILLLTVVRIGWRLAHPAIPLPDHLPRWQKLIARGTHVGFYLVLIAMPLGGWLAMSFFGRPIDMYGIFDWPTLPVETSRDAGRSVIDLHEMLAKALYVLIAAHVAGALKHHFINKDNVARRMLPFLPRRP
ncbi:cytochrome b [Brevundimonas sp. 2R-24]|uniref:Cytochrome b n=1 Tax=Peiella sedimenti TaxID=3061083 RepID=A0ABT8SIK5_9CAUL|nr:cytochrome b [Caulobacteraceae bacterium XZ-24]